MAEEEDSSPVLIQDPLVGLETGRESSLSNWAGDYVTDMLGKGQALADEGYNAYTGPLTAGTSDLQDTTFSAFDDLSVPTEEMGAFSNQAFDATAAQQYMNPYLMSALQPQIDEARRQSEIDRVGNASRMTQAGSFGGSRQAVLEGENQRALQSNLAGITGQGYLDAFNTARDQFNTEQDRGITAQTATNQYGRDLLSDMAGAGAIQRDIESEGLVADRLQFEEERDFPYKQVQFMQSLLDGLPIASQSYSYAEPSDLSNMLGTSAGLKALYDYLFKGDTAAPATKKETA